MHVYVGNVCIVCVLWGPLNAARRWASLINLCTYTICYTRTFAIFTYSHRQIAIKTSIMIAYSTIMANVNADEECDIRHQKVCMASGHVAPIHARRTYVRIRCPRLLPLHVGRWRHKSMIRPDSGYMDGCAIWVEWSPSAYCCWFQWAACTTRRRLYLLDVLAKQPIQINKFLFHGYADSIGHSICIYFRHLSRLIRSNMIIYTHANRISGLQQQFWTSVVE